tara:strand:+ start:9210 stop:9962 length:753 start_codon:yes stop_codon:yes gene_type:complete
MGRRRGKFSRATTLNAIRASNVSTGVTVSVADPITIPDKVDVIVSKGSDFQVIFKHNVLYSFFTTLETPALTRFKLNIINKLKGSPLEYYRKNGYRAFWLAFYDNKGDLNFHEGSLKALGSDKEGLSYARILNDIQQFQQHVSFDIKLKDSGGATHASSATLKYNESVTLPNNTYSFSAPLNDSLTSAKDGFTANETVFYYLTDDSDNTVPLTVSASATIAVSLSQITVSSVSISTLDLKTYNNLLYNLL